MAGARASANLYGLIETAKANGIEPGRYLAHLFEVLPTVTSADQLDALLPQNLDRERLQSSRDRMGFVDRLRAIAAPACRSHCRDDHTPDSAAEDEPLEPRRSKPLDPNAKPRPATPAKAVPGRSTGHSARRLIHAASPQHIVDSSTPPKPTSRPPALNLSSVGNPHETRKSRMKDPNNPINPKIRPTTARAVTIPELCPA